MPRLLGRLSAVLLLLVVPALGGAADGGAPAAAEIVLQRKLDQPITLDLPNIELSEAFKQIATAAKIPLQVDPACYDLLPYGATTRVSVTFRQSTLRDAIEEVLVPLGLQQTISSGGGASVIIRPSGPLARIGRRAEWEELKLLQELRTSSDLKASPPAGASGAQPPFSLIDALRASLDDRKDLIVSIPPDAPNNAAALEQLRKQLPLSPFRALDLYCQLTNQIWFVEAGPLNGGPTGGAIRIMSQRKWIERQLDRPIQLSRTNEPLEVVVADLSNASGIRFVPEPGLYQAFPVVTLGSNNGSVLQTLETLAGVTRIAFDVRDDSILLHLTAGPGNQPPKADPFIGHLTIAGPDGTQIDFYLRESDLPPALDELRKKHIQDAIDNLQKTWATTPETQPAPPAASTRSAGAPAVLPGPGTSPNAAPPATMPPG